MAFDAGMLAAALSEIRETSLGGRVEKIYQPERDEIVIQLRTLLGGRRILVNAGSNNPRICFSALQRENPSAPPMFCMLLRKHLSGGKLVSVEQPDFERMAILGFECRDEMGFECRKYLVAEVMGKYSNLIFADENMRIISAHRPVDFTTSSRRQVLSGMKYEAPPSQQKLNPLTSSREDFDAAYASYPDEGRADKFVLGTYLGISAAVAREMVYGATRHADTPKKYCDGERLWQEFSRVTDIIKQEKFTPTAVSLEGRPVEYAFMPLLQYGQGAELREFESAGALLDSYYGERDREQKIKQRASDIIKLVGNAEARITKKLENQRTELAECDKGEQYRREGDLITSSIYMIQKGADYADLTDYSEQREDGSFAVCRVKLDPKLTPAANAQRLYKKYNKSKHARVELARQIELGERELAYLASVRDALERSESIDDLSEIRAELYGAGYASKMKSYSAPKKIKSNHMKFVTDGGYTLLCGRNNTQNEYITHKLAEKNDYWFHVKGAPGSHVVMVTGGEEPSELDFTQAARIAALYSSQSEGKHVAVDYTLVKHLKKTPGAKPGFVIYHTNWSAYVTPDAEEAERLRCK